ncbi:MAG: hypothetical protein M0Z65_12875 [Firmicutes bacterium]|nr:hypothetical protein [Bacillota bacterium]
MNEKRKGDFTINIGGSVNERSLIGDFSGNNNIIYNEQSKMTDEKLKNLEHLIQEFIKLIQSSRPISDEEIETTVKLLQKNQQMIKDRQADSTLIKASKLHLKGIKEKLKDDSPLLDNIGSISQILSLFL